MFSLLADVRKENEELRKENEELREQIERIMPKRKRIVEAVVCVNNIYLSNNKAFITTYYGLLVADTRSALFDTKSST